MVSVIQTDGMTTLTRAAFGPLTKNGAQQSDFSRDSRRKRETRLCDPPGLRQGTMEDDLWDILSLADQAIQIIPEGVRRDVATVGDVTPDKIAVTNVYDEIVFAWALAAFDDSCENLHTKQKVGKPSELEKIIQYRIRLLAYIPRYVCYRHCSSSR
jgi:hypothetical protein